MEMKKILTALVALIFLFSLASVALAEDIKIGAIYPLSGALATTGKDLRAGCELGRDVVNTKFPGIDIDIAKWEGIPNLNGAKIKLIFADHRADPSRGADLAKRLIKDQKVVMLMGCYNSSVTKTVSAVAERYQLPMLNPESSSPTLTERGLKWFWRTSPHDADFTREIYEFLEGLTNGKVRGVGKVSKKDLDDVAIATENTEYGAKSNEFLRMWAKKIGYNVVASVVYPHGSPDVSAEVRKILSAKPDCIFHASYISDSILFYRTYKTMGVYPNIVWGNSAGFAVPEFIKTLGKDTDGTLVRSVFSPRLAGVKEIVGQVNSFFKKRTGHDLSPHSARDFIGVQTIAHILNNAGSTDPHRIQKAANELEIPGDQVIAPWEKIKFGAYEKHTNQNIFGKGLIVQIQNGVLEVVFPFELATADMIYPFRGWK